MAALEIDASASFRRWLAKRRSVLERIAVEGTWLDHQDVSKLLRLSLPGIDELAALIEISRLSRKRGIDLVVVDTAPTGHTLRMLAMPELLQTIADVFDVMREKRRVMEEALRGIRPNGSDDVLIDEMSTLARDLSDLLRDRSRTRVSWVTTPEPMAIQETAHAIDELRSEGIEVGGLIVNRLTPVPPQRCQHCDSRRAFEARAIKALPPMPAVSVLTARATEPRGARALMAIGRELEQRRQVTPVGRSGRWTASLDGARADPGDLVGSSTRLVMFGGKGGVGKTTCAAAVALEIAERDSARRVLLVSTDPAHSLSDVLGSAMTDKPAGLPRGPENLGVREIDPAAVLARIRDRYLLAVDEMFDRIGGRSFDAAHDRAVMRSLIQLAPPGLDELAAILEITDAVSTDPPVWDLVVMDTAPTGHALRLLEMPALLHDWTKALMGVLLKYQAIARLGVLGETLLDLSRGLRRLRDLLSNAELSSFILVTRAAALPRLESVRLAERLAELRVHVPAILVNGLGRGTCARCKRTASGERREIRRIRRALESSQKRLVVLAGTEVPPPLGARALRRWARTAWHIAPGYHRGP
jgi:arsenite-transporting ATPase